MKFVKIYSTSVAFSRPVEDTIVLTSGGSTVMVDCQPLNVVVIVAVEVVVLGGGMGGRGGERKEQGQIEEGGWG